MLQVVEVIAVRVLRVASAAEVARTDTLVWRGEKLILAS